MKESHILTGPPVTLSNSQPMRQARHSDTAQDYQDGLQRTNDKKRGTCIKGHDREEYSRINTRGHSFCVLCQKIAIKQKKDKVIRAERARERYKNITREEMDARNEAGRKGYQERRA